MSVIYPFHVVCRRTDGTREISLTIDSASNTVQNLIRQVDSFLRTQGIDPQTKVIRLIFAGKLLSPPTALVSAFNITPGSYIHCVINDRRPEEAVTESNGGGIRGLVGSVGAYFLGRSSSGRSTTNRAGDNGGGASDSINNSNNTNNSSDIDLNIQNQGPSRHQGLDILQRSHALEPMEVAALRAIFREDIENFARELHLTYTSGAGIDSDNAAMNERIEMAWVMRQGASSEFFANLPRRQRSNPTEQNMQTMINEHSSRANELQSAVRARVTRMGSSTASASPVTSRTNSRTTDSDSDRGSDSGSDDESARPHSPTLLEVIAQRLRPQGEYAVVRETSAHGTGDIESGVRMQSLAQPQTQVPQPLWDWQITGNLPEGNDEGTVFHGINEFGTPRDFLWGFLLGFSLGSLMLICVFERSLNYRHKIGVICGILTQLILSICVQQNTVM